MLLTLELWGLSISCCLRPFFKDILWNLCMCIADISIEGIILVFFSIICKWISVMTIVLFMQMISFESFWRMHLLFSLTVISFIVYTYRAVWLSSSFRVHRPYTLINSSLTFIVSHKQKQGFTLFVCHLLLWTGNFRWHHIAQTCLLSVHLADSHCRWYVGVKHK